MSRTRNIKPDFFLNEELAELDPLARLLFIGLWTIADREGKLEDRPKKIKAQILPYDDVNIDQLLGSLVQKKGIVRYTLQSPKNEQQCLENKQWIKIVHFSKHQHPHRDERNSLIPDPIVEKHQQCTNNTPNMHGANTPIISNIVTCKEKVNQKEKSKSVLIRKTNSEFKDRATEVLDFLNETCKRRYRATDVNLGLIISRLREGFTDEECTMVIAAKRNEWENNSDMEKFLRPKTLFGKTNFHQYVGEIKL